MYTVWRFPGRRRNLQSLSDTYIHIFALHTDGGVVNVHCLASGDVVTLNFVVAWRWGVGMLTFFA